MTSDDIATINNEISIFFNALSTTVPELLETPALRRLLPAILHHGGNDIDHAYLNLIASLILEFAINNRRLLSIMQKLDALVASQGGQ